MQDKQEEKQLTRKEIDPETGIEYELELCGGFWIRKRRYRSDCQYRPWMCDAIIEVAKKGGNIAAMCVRLGISRNNFTTYRKNFPELEDAFQYTKLINQMLDEERLLKMANGELGKEANFKAQELRMMTMYPEDYRRQANNISIDVNTTNNTINLSPAERQRRLVEIIGQAKSIPHLNITKEQECIDADIADADTE